jgi:hypothetical protein
VINTAVASSSPSRAEQMLFYTVLGWCQDGPKLGVIVAAIVSPLLMGKSWCFSVVERDGKI